MTNQVTVTDGFFSNYMELVRREVIPYQWKALNDEIPGAEKSGCIHNFKVTAGEETGEFYGMVFQDSDLAKWLEAAAYSLANHPDKELEAQVDSVIDLMGRAQREDGYLDTYFILKEPQNRWRCIRDCHELYCAGHFIEAAVAYYRATGKDKLLNILRKYVDLIASVFGKGEGQLPAYPGHEEIELALCKLYDVIGDEKYLNLAKYFIDERGQEPKYFIKELDTRGDTFHWDGNDHYGLPYFQSHAPVREQQDATGHAVRDMYLCTGMADVATRTNDKTLKEACWRLAKSVYDKQMYVTGAIGSTHHGEAFTFDYDLPNDTVYGETCASIGLIFFMKRMLEMEHNALYADVMERALYNTVLAGMALDGKSFFYVNPLEVFPEADKKDPLKAHVKTVRQKWFACACCPPNVARLLSDIGEYIYQAEGDTVTVNLFIGSKLSGKDFTLLQESGVPYDGKASFTVNCESEKKLTLRIRKPFWASEVQCDTDYAEDKGYLVIEKTFRDGECVSFDFAMPVRRVYANPAVREDVDKVAVMRGPLVYCLEEKDNGKNLHLVHLPEDATFTERCGNGILFGIKTLQTTGYIKENRQCSLYSFEKKTEMTPCTLHFIPYFAWANRGENEMTVWVRE